MNCTQPVCHQKCNPTGGQCTAPDTCTCNAKWTGGLCDVLTDQTSSCIINSSVLQPSFYCWYKFELILCYVILITGRGNRGNTSMILTANSQGISANDSDRFTFIEVIAIIVSCDCYCCNDPVDMICNCYFTCKTKLAINTFKLTG